MKKVLLFLFLALSLQNTLPAMKRPRQERLGDYGPPKKKRLFENPLRSEEIPEEFEFDFSSDCDILTAINYRASRKPGIGFCFIESTCFFLREKTAVGFSTDLTLGMPCPNFTIFFAAFISLS